MVSLEKRIIIFYLYLYLYFFFFNFLFLPFFPFNRLGTRLYLLKNSQSIIYFSSTHHHLYHLLLSSQMPVGNFGIRLKARAWNRELCFYGCKDRVFSRCLLQKMRLKILIPNKNRINETLKNPEKRLFLYVFCVFFQISTSFNLLFFAFSLFSRTFAVEKNNSVN